MARLNFSRQILPILAVIAIIVAAVLVLRTQPNRAIAQPARTPPNAPAGIGATVAGAGVVEPASELIEIGAQVPGVVDRVFVAAGDSVPANAPLFSVDSREARAAVDEAGARLQRLRQNAAAASTTLSVARRQFALYAEAGDPRAVSRQEVIARQGSVEDAAAQVAVARAQVREAEAQLESARVALARHLVRAPRAATVLQLRTREGEYAPAGQQGNGNQEPLMTMGVTDPLHVRIDVDENEIWRVAIGQPAIVSPKGAAGQRIRARFVRAEPLIVPKRSLTNASTERVDIRVLQLIYALPASSNRFFIGQQVDGFIPARAAR
ncbi:efflux RND transporter periplasmic adaptor subunit [Sphingomonas radiodurans]|uniref:efflux RND transporter periplasmic adaptor subunit n=1 Tax=Sphingomonas radiodurans TaxID=2890321 RepID=UPI001E43CB1E|nr:efflux RND transporter periplasmic adaptor subunit [Sphingomonas radiodurans]WBH15054.1 efflux RND transporter periplasmic adaptor subunit [Sphingomonas radiodurans]